MTQLRPQLCALDPRAPTPAPRRHHARSRARARGATILEVIVVVTLVIILASLARPALTNTINDELTRGLGYDLQAISLLARTRSMSDNRYYRLRVDTVNTRWYLDRSVAVYRPPTVVWGAMVWGDDQGVINRLVPIPAPTLTTFGNVVGTFATPPGPAFVGWQRCVETGLAGGTICSAEARIQNVTVTIIHMPDGSIQAGDGTIDFTLYVGDTTQITNQQRRYRVLFHGQSGFVQVCSGWSGTCNS